MRVKTVQVFIPEDLWAEVKIFAAEKKKTLSKVVEEALRRYLSIEKMKAAEREA
jgi:metal-responsive CopG/Arc/MetJ family transcriptional regulator